MSTYRIRLDVFITPEGKEKEAYSKAAEIVNNLHFAILKEREKPGITECTYDIVDSLKKIRQSDGGAR